MDVPECIQEHNLRAVFDTVIVSGIFAFARRGDMVYWYSFSSMDKTWVLKDSFHRIWLVRLVYLNDDLKSWCEDVKSLSFI